MHPPMETQSRIERFAHKNFIMRKGFNLPGMNANPSGQWVYSTIQGIPGDYQDIVQALHDIAEVSHKVEKVSQYAKKVLQYVIKASQYFK